MATIDSMVFKGIYKFRYNVIEAIQQVFPFKSIYEKMRFKDSEYTGGHVIGEAPDFPIVIEENFTFYNVDLDDGLMRYILRSKKYVRNYVIILQKKDILNLFSYTGAFSVVVRSKC